MQLWLKKDMRKKKKKKDMRKLIPHDAFHCAQSCRPQKPLQPWPWGLLLLPLTAVLMLPIWHWFYGMQSTRVVSEYFKEKAFRMGMFTLYYCTLGWCNWFYWGSQLKLCLCVSEESLTGSFENVETLGLFRRHYCVLSCMQATCTDETVNQLLCLVTECDLRIYIWVSNW